ncbi:MAG: RnfABCDGE type electron transport complex subunit G, partial [Bacteroidetes bacterium]|nr:RnfABCDGE type electron transport complex subunit G [Bacteroidota bacterium]
MAKKESSFLNMVITLFLVTGLAATALGFVYEYTKEPIAAAKLKAKLDAVSVVVPEFDNNPSEEMYTLESDLGVLECYPAKMGGELVGTAISTLTKMGFSGEITLMVGFTTDGTIINSAPLDHLETPGLGTKMDKPKFKDQFIDKNPGTVNVKVTKDGGVIDAITASTITSRAYCDAIQRAFDA